MILGENTKGITEQMHLGILCNTELTEGSQTVLMDPITFLKIATASLQETKH